MSEQPNSETLIRKIETNLERVLQADHLAEEEKVTVLKEALALAATEEGTAWQR
jgi:hypothetical protein